MSGQPATRAARAAAAAGADPIAVKEEIRRRKPLAGGNPKSTRLQTRIAELSAHTPLLPAPEGFGLTEMQTKFVQFKAAGMSDVQAARHAGYQHPKVQGPQVGASKTVLAAVQAERTQYEVSSQMTKKRVLDGFLEAVEQAKLLADPIAQISGWREVAKLCGYFEPQKHEIAVSVQGNLVVQKIQQLSDAELLRLAEGEVIEGEILDREG